MRGVLGRGWRHERHKTHRFHAGRIDGDSLLTFNMQPLTEMGTAERRRPLTATFVTSSEEIGRLDSFVRSLASEPGMLAPGFFLASVSPKGWRPLLVVVSQGRQVAGLLYCKERVIAGIGIRIAFADDALGCMIAADPEEADSIMSCAVRALLKRMFALRLLVSSDRLPLLSSIQESADLSYHRTKAHAHLELSRTYDGFLGRLGPRTRRNFRYYRRKSELAGNEFVSAIEFPDFCAAAGRLLPKAAYATCGSKETQQRHLAMIEAIPSRLLVGLRTAAGQWIGLLGGWYEADRAIILMQLNDRTCDCESVSVVLRSYLIEAAIDRGCRELVFWGGSSAPLSCYSVYPDMFMTHLDVRSIPWRMGRHAWGAIRKLAPSAFGRLLNSFVRGL